MGAITADVTARIGDGPLLADQRPSRLNASALIVERRSTTLMTVRMLQSGR